MWYDNNFVIRKISLLYICRDMKIIEIFYIRIRYRDILKLNWGIMYISFVKFIEYIDMLKCKLMLIENLGSRVCDRRFFFDSEC